MKVFSEKAATFRKIEMEAHLNFFDRQKSRINVKTTAGEEIGIILPRGQSLTCGDVLRAECGTHLRVRGFPEHLSVVDAKEKDLVRAAYHLGNRHIPVAVLDDQLCYQKDHVIDEMMENLGFHVDHAYRVFTPEKGAYHKHH